mgnify:CR=1 FL=1
MSEFKELIYEYKDLAIKIARNHKKIIAASEVINVPGNNTAIINENINKFLHENMEMAKSIQKISDKINKLNMIKEFAKWNPTEEEVQEWHYYDSESEDNDGV